MDFDKPYTIKDDKGCKNLLISAKSGVYQCLAYDEKLRQNNKLFNKATILLQNKSGEIIVCGCETKLMTCRINDGKMQQVLFQDSFIYLDSVNLSPQQHYLQILDKVDANYGHTILYLWPKMIKTKQFKQNMQSHFFNSNNYPLIRFTKDDKRYFRYNLKRLQIYTSQHHELEGTIDTGAFEFFEISTISTMKQYYLSVFYLDANNKTGFLRIYNQSSQQAVYEKVIKKAEQIKCKFNPISNDFLMQLQTYHDPTGKSYYGEYGLFIHNSVNKKINKVKIAGPLHDFSWNRKGNYFIAICGFMPASSILFNANNQKIFQFDKHHKNTIIWGNLNRFVCLAGFGNLNGEMQIWDLQTKTKIGVCKSNSASYCFWSPDDRKLLTSIVTPRLRVDNCFKIFSYTGILLNKMIFEEELYEVTWQNSLLYQNSEAKGLSPGRKIGKQENKTVKTFAQSLNFSKISKKNGIKTDEPKLVPGQHPQEIKNKRKKKTNKWQKGVQE